MQKPYAAVSLILILCVAVLGCETIQNVQNDPVNRRREVSASAYSLGGCQEKMDELVGGHVQMTGHTQAILVSLLNLGLIPWYECHGIIADSQKEIGEKSSTSTGSTAR
jgi:hypothetical protein